MRWLAIILLLLVAGADDANALFGKRMAGASSSSSAVSNEEFVGPFASWACLRSSASGTCGAATAAFYNAAGTGGVTNDTVAFENALQGLGSATPVLYVPAGTYNIANVETTATQASVGATTIVVASAAGIAIGMTVGDVGGAGLFPYGDIVTNIVGTTITLQNGTSGVLNNTAVSFNPALANVGQVKIICQDPSSTIFNWTGSTDGAGLMLYISSVNYSSFNRCSFLGHGGPSVIINQSPANGSPYTFDTGNEYTDDIMDGAQYGFICGGSSQNGCAELTLKRDTISNQTAYGLWLGNGNAADVWNWYNTFTNDTIGVTNGNCCSNYHVFYSVFQNNTTEDITWRNPAKWDIVGNWSSGSGYFIYANGGSFNPSVIMNNHILNTTNAASIYIQDPGPSLVLANSVLTKPGATSQYIGSTGVQAQAGFGPVITVGTGGPSDLLSKDNYASVGSAATSCTASTTTGVPNSPVWSLAPPGRCRNFNDQVVSPSSPLVNVPQPTLPPTPPRLGRTIWEALPAATGNGNSANSCTGTTTATACDLQSAICKAATGSTAFAAGACTGTVLPEPNRAVAHLQPGNYMITQTISVPASDIQIIGDGPYSQIYNNGATFTTGADLKLAGPSHVVLRDFAISQGTTTDSIEIDNADQPGALVWADQFVPHVAQINVYAPNLTTGTIELHDVQAQQAGTAGIQIGSGGTINIFCGLNTSNSGPAYITAGGAMMIQGVWDDGQPYPEANVSGSGYFTYVGNNTSVSYNAPSVMNLTSYGGKALIGLLWANSPGGTPTSNYKFNIATASGGEVLGLGMASSLTSPPFWNSNTSAGGNIQFLNSSTYDGTTVTPLSETTGATPAFVGDVTQQLENSKPTVQVAPTPGVTGVYLYRIMTTNGRYGLYVLH